MATESTNKPTPPSKPEQGPAPGQRAQTTTEPGRTTVAQKEPEKVPENKTGSTNPVTAAKSQEDLDKAAVESHNAPADSSVRVKSIDEVNKAFDSLIETVEEELQSIAGEGNSIDDVRSQFIGRLRRGPRSVGAAPIRHTSGGTPLEQLDKARAEGKAPVQGGF